VTKSSRARLALLLGLTLLGARASAAPKSVVAAVNANDVAALETLSKSAPTAEERSLGAGSLLALRHEDAKAVAMLSVVSRSEAPHDVRATAYRVLSGIYLRDQRYRECDSAILAAAKLSGPSAQSRQSIAQAPMGVKPMRVLHEVPGAVPITKESESIIRVPVEINGRRRGAMVDTGASFSTISASVAKRVGITLLALPATVGSSTERALAVRVGIAKRLQIGQAILENVVFIVVPDSAWGIPPKFQISALIGLPVLLALGRLEFVNSAAPALLYDVPRGKLTSQDEVHPNMLLSGLEPLVLVRVTGKDAPLVMKLDTGSNSTSFTQKALADAPVLLAQAERYVDHSAGIGGTVTDRQALRLPKMTLNVGGQPITLKNVVVSSQASSTSDGVLGADLFGQGARWTMDFETMTLAVSK
jgi:predicted aspartyl protease